MLNIPSLGINIQRLTWNAESGNQYSIFHISFVHKIGEEACNFSKNSLKDNLKCRIFISYLKEVKIFLTRNVNDDTPWEDGKLQYMKNVDFIINAIHAYKDKNKT